MLREKVNKAWALILIQQRSSKENHNVLSIHICMCVSVQIHPVCIYVSICIWMGVSIHTLTHTHIHTNLRIARNFAQTSLFCVTPFPWWKPTIVAHLHWWSSWVKKLETGIHSLHSVKHILRDLWLTSLLNRNDLFENGKLNPVSPWEALCFTLWKAPGPVEGVWGSQVSRPTSNCFCWFHLLNVIVAQAYETQK